MTDKLTDEEISEGLKYLNTPGWGHPPGHITRKALNELNGYRELEKERNLYLDAAPEWKLRAEKAEQELKEERLKLVRLCEVKDQANRDLEWMLTQRDGWKSRAEKAEADREKLVGALKFYGFEAIHNPVSANKAEQYWNDSGIYDHGARARQALKEVGESGGGDE
jgi:hypothetical protein